MSVLTDADIRKLVETDDLIESFDADSVQGASYDMRLGHQYVRHGQVHTLTDDAPTLVLAPGEFAILRSYEELNMPNNLVGHNGIMSPWAKKGLVSLFSPQIDPGFKGFLIVPVFNAGDANIPMDFKGKIFTVEFMRTAHRATYGWSDKYGRQKDFVAFTSPSFTRPNFTAIETAITDLSTRLGALEQRQTKLDADVQIAQAHAGVRTANRQVSVSVWNLVATVVAVVLTGFGVYIAMANREPDKNRTAPVQASPATRPVPR